MASLGRLEALLPDITSYTLNKILKWRKRNLVLVDKAAHQRETIFSKNVY